MKECVDLCLRIPPRNSPRVRVAKESVYRLDWAIGSFLISGRLEEGYGELQRYCEDWCYSSFGSRPVIHKHWSASESHGGQLKKKLLSLISRDS